MEKKKSIQEIKKEFDSCAMEQWSKLYESYQFDSRLGVQKIIEGCRKKEENLKKEKERVAKLREYEDTYVACQSICGIDEVGRGPLAGPVVAGAVILPEDCEILFINDSKKLSEKQRENLYTEIYEKAIAVGIGMAPRETIDKINILQATYEAMRMAIRNLSVRPDLLLNDAVTIPNVDIPQIPIIKGDTKSISIAAASIVAKVTRDRMMVEYDKIYPEYGFASNKGYGSAVHIEAIRKYGPCELHRRTFLKNFITKGSKEYK